MGSPGDVRDCVELRLLATSDLHAHLMAYDYSAGRRADGFGLARTASLIRAARAEAANVLLFDNGDTIQGSLLGELAASAPPCGRHPMIAAMDLLGYDAATLGNHDFDFGIDFALDVYAAASFPVVASNVVAAPGGADAEGVPLFRPRVILKRLFSDTAGRPAEISVGVVGLVPPQTADWDRRHFASRAAVRDMVAAAEEHVRALRDEGADVVVALAHTGIAGTGDRHDGENAAVPLARIAGIDALILGHTHRVFPETVPVPLQEVDGRSGTIAGKPAAMPGYGGSHLAVLDLLLERRRRGWTVRGHRVEVRAVHQRTARGAVARTVPEDNAVTRLAAAAHARTLAHSGTRVGRTDCRLHTYFSLVHESAALRLVSEAQIWHAEGVLARSGFAGVPILSAVSPFRAGGLGGPENYTEVEGPEIELRHIADLYPFLNTVVLVELSGAEVRDWLDRSAAVFNPVEPGVPAQRLFDWRTPGYCFDVLDGLSYAIDLSRPARDPARDPPGASRIVELCRDGRRVHPDDRFVAVTNSHRAVSLGVAPPAAGPTRIPRLILDGPETNREILRRYVEHKGRIAPGRPGTWRFVPMPGTTVVFPSGPRARAFLDAPDAPAGATPFGSTAEGFHLFRLAL